MASFTFNPLQQKQLFPITLCKCLSTLNTFKFQFSSHFLSFSPTKHTLQPILSPLVVRAHVSHIDTKLSSTDEELSKNTMNHKITEECFSGFSPFRTKYRRLDKKSVKNNVGSIVKDIKEQRVKKGGQAKQRLSSRNRSRANSSGSSSMGSKDANLVRKMLKPVGNLIDRKKIEKKIKKSDDNRLGDGKTAKGSKKSKVDSPGDMLRVGLDMCSKKGDVMGAIKLYDSARRESIKMGQYHYTVLLYLCSSAATGVVQPAKSGNGSRSLSMAGSSIEFSDVIPKGLGELKEMGERNSVTSKSNVRVSSNGRLVEFRGHSDTAEVNTNSFPMKLAKDDLDNDFDEKHDLSQISNDSMKQSPRALDAKGDDDSSNIKDGSGDQEDNGIQVSVNVKRFALQSGFEIYETMLSEEIPLNEATLTSVARMAMSMGDGHMAFDMVKQMKALGINPRLRSYGPALSVFCNRGDVEKAFSVEEHMLEYGVYPEEPELDLLLRVSTEAGRSDKVYYLLHKLRTNVRKVSPSTADLIEKWFKSKKASRVGKRNWDQRLIREAIANGGGGWHGQGWLGKGKWTVSRTSVGANGLCKCCGEKLAIIDLDPTETENFAKSVASIALQREKNSNFQKFQKWLDYYGPFEAVVDAANVGLYSQRKFKPSKVNAVVNGIRQMLPSKKWPLIILHNRRITGDKMDEPVNKALIEKWRNADAIYATPTGSNDDWYWLYAAIKFKCLIVTNDEMRDHLFQLLGNDFFPKWKERHQVHFSFSDTGPVFHMPPPCSVVIQESEKGHWHIPIVFEHDSEGERTWLCVTRASSHMAMQASTTIHEGSQFPHHEKGHANSDAETRTQDILPPHNIGNHKNTKHPPQEIYRNLRNILSTSIFSNHSTIVSEIEAAEEHGSCVIDFQI
ncbi:proteinaceous RNase P 1, chloroplastic/mitochondrial-like [Cornus florida]|uniref:proteinaceous RNase P 1, chloroplastic/mitochondrial-like n=1 Tax=Cornus florida TaxID=4283 RepID=UPI00289DA7D4|nr:proteinaceous RNase P 1, chloroplastic/mitochondrial-like [Cornus florida]